MNNLIILFLFIIIIGTILTISSNNFFSAWLGLEINLISFLPILSNNYNSLENESILKYFLIQTIGSSIFLLSTLLNSIYLNNNIFLIINLLIILALLLKIAASPFHNWLINLINGTNWLRCFLILTWQKIAPLTLCFFCFLKLSYIRIFIIFSALFGAIGALNQTSIKKILAFSSINHLRWIITSFFISKFILIIYFFIYFLINLNLILIFKTFSIFYLNQIYNLIIIIHKIIIFLVLFSLAGLPPFTGFLSKWLIIENLFLNNFNFISIILILSSLITLYFYTQILFSSLLILKINYKFLINSYFFFWIYFFSLFSIFRLILFLIFKTCS